MEKKLWRHLDDAFSVDVIVKTHKNYVICDFLKFYCDIVNFSDYFGQLRKFRSLRRKKLEPVM